MLGNIVLQCNYCLIFHETPPSSLKTHILQQITLLIVVCNNFVVMASRSYTNITQNISPSIYQNFIMKLSAILFCICRKTFLLSVHLKQYIQELFIRFPKPLKHKLSFICTAQYSSWNIVLKCLMNFLIISSILEFLYVLNLC